MTWKMKIEVSRSPEVTWFSRFCEHLGLLGSHRSAALNSLSTASLETAERLSRFDNSDFNETARVLVGSLRNSVLEHVRSRQSLCRNDHLEFFELCITCKRSSTAVVRTSCCSNGEGRILHFSRAETTEPINTKFWKIDYLVEIKRIAKFGSDWLYGVFSLCGWNVHFYCYFFLFCRSGYRPQFATDFDVIWLKRRRLA